MSPGGTDASLLELGVGFFAAASLIAVITMVLRRRSGRQDLLGTQMREMEARTAAAAPDAAAQIARAHSHEAVANIAAPAEAGHDAPTFATDAPSPVPGFPDAAMGERAAQDATAPPEERPSVPGGKNDAMADAFAWLRIAALVEAGQREQATELLRTTMAISADEAAMLVDGLNDAAGERPSG